MNWLSTEWYALLSLLRKSIWARKHRGLSIKCQLRKFLTNHVSNTVIVSSWFILISPRILLTSCNYSWKLCYVLGNQLKRMAGCDRNELDWNVPHVSRSLQPGTCSTLNIYFCTFCIVNCLQELALTVRQIAWKKTVTKPNLYSTCVTAERMEKQSSTLFVICSEGFQWCRTQEQQGRQWKTWPSKELA